MWEAGNYECDMAVKVGRPTSKAEILDMIRGHAKAKAVGIGHRWGHPRFKDRGHSTHWAEN